MKKVIVSSNRQSREHKSNPHIESDLNSRLKKSNCMWYENNIRIETQDLGNGYSRIEISENKEQKQPKLL
ncbi:hypothetical protein [Trichococcus shcherbakoviae]|uniref:hypothetical protein n=1 Tax=Trichococcus shcherbakoviae TaxID=2094020 RepID=UPI002AA60F32|nr:hypothetical protein [Trichococcus shcherbakoviae]